MENLKKIKDISSVECTHFIIPAKPGELVMGSLDLILFAPAQSVVE